MDSDNQNTNLFEAASTADVVTPFPGVPAERYGLQPGATRYVAELAETMHATFEKCQPHAMAAAAKACLRSYLCETELLAPEQKQGAKDNYRRHLLYAAPDKSFSLLAIVWSPGQKTQIHGHSSWGAVGVYSGQPFCEDFTTTRSERGRISVQSNMTLRLKEGDIASVEPGIDDVHRIGNDRLDKAITIHAYGRDLLAAPTSINIYLDELNN